MAGLGDSVLPEGCSINKPPGFNGQNFTYWKMKIKLFFQALDLDIWDVIEKGDFIPTKEVDGRITPKTKDEFNENERRLVLLNHKARLILASALSQEEYFRVSNCTTAREMWDALEITHEGTSGVKENRVNTLTTKYELFRMKEGESIRDMEIRFSHIINHLTALGKIYNQRDQVRKILSSLTMEWQPKVTAIEETKGESMTLVATLFGSLAEYEGKLKVLRETQDKRKKGLALQVLDEDDDEEDNKELDDQTMGLIVYKFGKFFRRQQAGKRFPCRDGALTSRKGNKQPLVCYKCKKLGHIKWECPQLAKK